MTAEDEPTMALLELALADMLAGADVARTAREQFDIAKERYDERRFKVRDHLAAMARHEASTGERLLAIEDARRLYWDFPDIHVGWIAPCLGVKKSEVYKIIGGRPQLKVTCRDCGGLIRFVPASRTKERAVAPWWHSDVCEPCRKTRNGHHQAAWAARDAEERRRAEKLAAAIAEGGYWISGDGSAVFRDSDPQWEWGHRNERTQQSCEHRHHLVDGDAAWGAGGDVVYRCSCGDWFRYQLVRFIPKNETDLA